MRCVSSVEEAIFFHSIARTTQYDFEIKGDKPFTENYSVIGPEVLTGPMGETLGTHNTKFIEQLQAVDKLIIAGQAKCHCVAWTVSDLLDDIHAVDPALAKKVYCSKIAPPLLSCPAWWITPTRRMRRMNDSRRAGMNIVKSTDEFLRRHVDR